jgi:flagellar biosynthetic protein FlhB
MSTNTGVAPVLGLLTLPALLAATIGATVAGLVEAGFHPQFALALPKWTRLDPLPRLTNMFSPKEAATNVALQSARVATVAIVAYLSIKETFPEVIRLSRTALSGAAVEAGDALFELAMWASVALLALVAVDYLHSRKRHEDQLRMTRHE